MSDYGGDQSDYDYDSDGDWLYVEDHYDEVDNLAEHTCPSPLPSGTDFNTSEYDPYDYWQDISYLSDGYEGGSRAKRKGKPIIHSPSRQKKRSRTDYSSNCTSKPPSLKDALVLWKSKKELEQSLDHVRFVDFGSLCSVSILEDWRERFKDITRVTLANDYSDEVVDGDIDLGDIRSIAGLLSGDSIDTLKSILRGKGLDPEALDVVLQDIVDGREPEFEEARSDAEDAEDRGHDPQNRPNRGKRGERAISLTGPKVLDKHASTTLQDHPEQHLSLPATAPSVIQAFDNKAIDSATPAANSEKQASSDSFSSTSKATQQQFSEGRCQGDSQVYNSSDSKTSPKMLTVGVDSAGSFCRSQQHLGKPVISAGSSSQDQASRKRKRSIRDVEADEFNESGNESTCSNKKRSNLEAPNVTRSGMVRKV